MSLSLFQIALLRFNHDGNRSPFSVSGRDIIPNGQIQWRTAVYDALIEVGMISAWITLTTKLALSEVSYDDN